MSPDPAAELAMLDIYLPMMKASALVTAGRLGLFQALAEGPLPVDALAARIGASGVGTSTLADFLLALGYLEARDGALANAPHTQRWFTTRGQVDYTPGLVWTHDAWGMLEDLPAAVRRGGPEAGLWAEMARMPGLGERFAAYMAAFARDLGPDLLRHVPVPAGAGRLLDLGGSHGLHSLRFCQAHPELHATVVDLPVALDHTPSRVAAAGLADRITIRPGALQDTDWGPPADLVFYLSVAHNHSAAENAAVFRRIAEHLRPGGVLVVHEYLADAPLPLFDAAFRLTLLLETGTRTHAEADYRAWLAAAGFARVDRVDLAPRAKGSLLFAHR